MRKETVAAIKRKDVKELAAIMCDAEGKTEEAAELRAAGRLTVALIDRTCIAQDVGDEPVDVEDTLEDEPVDVEDPEETVDHDFKDIKKAIKKGKGKKAMKLIIEAKEQGARGSVLKDLQKQAEAL